ncbi:hypothetical protein CONCODRAFT_12889 [Conidiobolus coronatus NRRL 28638]|uniref:Uncharacterized protein n=1 Tax=Conidiobolus coronatus (strain ATCC 28846 / CBS 209.66 / NRRL 28638) TaxID=796925 RepID=A0A137NRX5_CONC2|nr:hypothetical protein CONCODRAFT_12889 [Conidiobolus coronatus NRRL 28638]|eukprot:KXN65505.1 hypothetical protein CONCODRAFT_12889 [Conidiobolus coronatus NRRL 28638]
MKFFNLSVLALASLVASEEANYPQEPLSPFFGYSLNKLKDFIEVSAPVLNKVSEAMGGPTYEGSDAIAAINGITPMIATFENAAAPLVSYFSFGGSEEKADDDDEKPEPKPKQESKDKKKDKKKEKDE